MFVLLVLFHLSILIANAGAGPQFIGQEKGEKKIFFVRPILFSQKGIVFNIQIGSSLMANTDFSTIAQGTLTLPDFSIFLTKRNTMVVPGFVTVKMLQTKMLATSIAAAVECPRSYFKI
jgi:hypothetical protein